ncbi:MAG: hypothetical protein AB7V43_00315 [Acidimicrobiia bacterium]
MTEYLPPTGDVDAGELTAFRAALDEQCRFAAVYLALERLRDPETGQSVDREALLFELFGPRPRGARLSGLYLGMWMDIPLLPMSGHDGGAMYSIPFARDFARVRRVGRELWRAPGGRPAGSRSMDFWVRIEKVEVTRAQRAEIRAIAMACPAIMSVDGFVQTLMEGDSERVSPAVHIELRADDSGDPSALRAAHADVQAVIASLQQSRSSGPDAPRPGKTLLYRRASWPATSQGGNS